MSRGFSLLEIAIVAAIVSITAGVVLAVGTRTADGIQNSQVQQDVLDYIQRERNAHVNRGMEGEALVFCPSVGGVCTANADEISAFRVAFPVPGALSPADRIASARFPGASFDFTPGELVVDAFARSVNRLGVPTATALRLRLKSDTVEDIVFRVDGAVVPSFDAPNALVVTPHISDIGTRTTPSPTPQSSPRTTFRARRVALE